MKVFKGWAVPEWGGYVIGVDLGESARPKEEYLWLECKTCKQEFDIIVSTPEQIDMCISESGHEGHDFEICDYEPEHDPL